MPALLLDRVIWGSEISVYEGNCTYRFDVSLNNGGPVWIELIWEYTVRLVAHKSPDHSDPADDVGVSPF